VTQIDAFPDGAFDVVLVDGQARPSCLKHAYTKVKPGGMLILDNADVPEYLAQTRQYLANFEVHHFYGIGPIWGVMWQTDIYIAQ
jgi:predicted O-methyltransferase YrrM